MRIDRIPEMSAEEFVTAWDNDRRGVLIDKMIERTITPDEQEELDFLQAMADEKIRREAPLPIAELEALEAELKARGLWHE